MKKIFNIILYVVVAVTVSGCVMLKVYPTEKDKDGESTLVKAIDPTAIPTGQNWATIRGVIDDNFDNINGTLDSVEVKLTEHADSITNYSIDINLRLLKSDTISMLANYTRNGELAAAIVGKLNVSDTAIMLSPYALTSELGDAGTSIGDVRDEIADSLNVLRPLYVAVADTATMLDPYALLTDLSEGGISLSAVQDEIADSLNVLRPLYVAAADTSSMLSPYALTSELGGAGLTEEDVSGIVHDSITDLLSGGIELSDVAVMIADSTGNTIGNYVTRKALIDSIAAAGTGTGVSITDVRDEIADSLNAIRSASVAGIALADSTGYTPGNYVTHTQLDAVGSGADSSLFVTVTRLTDSLNVMRSLINDLIAVVENLGVDLSAPIIDSLELGRFADDTLMIFLSEKMNTDSLPASSVFYLTEGGTEMGIASIGFQNDSVLYVVLDSAGVYGSTYLLDYTRDYPYLQDSTGNALANFTDRAVTNYFEEPEAGVPAFLSSDGYTWSWLEADAANLTLNGTQITAINDIGPSNHDWAGNGTPGAQWDAVNGEIDFTYNTDANLELTTSPSSLPVTVYMVVNIATWADGNALMYFTVPTARISQGGSTNELLLYAGQYNLFAGHTIGSYAVITATLNGATSSIQWNDNTAVTGNAGTTGISGIYLGYATDNATYSTKEVIVRNTADSAQNIADIKAYLYSKYSITP